MSLALAAENLRNAQVALPVAIIIGLLAALLVFLFLQPARFQGYGRPDVNRWLLVVAIIVLALVLLF